MGIYKTYHYCFMKKLDLHIHIYIYKKESYGPLLRLINEKN